MDDTISSIDLVNLLSHPKAHRTEVENEEIGKILKQHPLLSRYNLRPEALHQVSSNSSLLSFSPNELIFQQNDLGERLYVILEGKVGLYFPLNHSQSFQDVRSHMSSDIYEYSTLEYKKLLKPIHVYEKDNWFGEVGLMSNGKMHLVAMAETYGHLMVIESKEYFRYFQEKESGFLKKKLAIFSSNLIVDAPISFQRLLYYTSKKRMFKHQEVLVDENDIVDNLFIIQKGEFGIYKNIYDSQQKAMTSNRQENQARIYQFMRANQSNKKGQSFRVTKLKVIQKNELVGEIDCMKSEQQPASEIGCKCESYSGGSAVVIPACVFRYVVDEVPKFKQLIQEKLTTKLADFNESLSKITNQMQQFGEFFFFKARSPNEQNLGVAFGASSNHLKKQIEAERKQKDLERMVFDYKKKKEEEESNNANFSFFPEKKLSNVLATHSSHTVVISSKDTYPEDTNTSKQINSPSKATSILHISSVKELQKPTLNTNSPVKSALQLNQNQSSKNSVGDIPQRRFFNSTSIQIRNSADQIMLSEKLTMPKEKKNSIIVDSSKLLAAQDNGSSQFFPKSSTSIAKLQLENIKDNVTLSSVQRKNELRKQSVQIAFSYDNRENGQIKPQRSVRYSLGNNSLRSKNGNSERDIFKENPQPLARSPQKQSFSYLDFTSNEDQNPKKMKSQSLIEINIEKAQRDSLGQFEEESDHQQQLFTPQIVKTSKQSFFGRKDSLAGGSELIKDKFLIKVLEETQNLKKEVKEKIEKVSLNDLASNNPNQLKSIMEIQQMYRGLNSKQDPKKYDDKLKNMQMRVLDLNIQLGRNKSLSQHRVLPEIPQDQKSITIRKSGDAISHHTRSQSNFSLQTKAFDFPTVQSSQNFEQNEEVTPDVHHNNNGYNNNKTIDQKTKDSIVQVNKSLDEMKAIGFLNPKLLEITRNQTPINNQQTSLINYNNYSLSSIQQSPSRPGWISDRQSGGESINDEIKQSPKKRKKMITFHSNLDEYLYMKANALSNNWDKKKIRRENLPMLDSYASQLEVNLKRLFYGKIKDKYNIRSNSDIGQMQQRIAQQMLDENTRIILSQSRQIAPLNQNSESEQNNIYFWRNSHHQVSQFQPEQSNSNNQTPRQSANNSIIHQEVDKTESQRQPELNNKMSNLNETKNIHSTDQGMPCEQSFLNGNLVNSTVFKKFKLTKSCARLNQENLQLGKYSFTDRSQRGRQDILDERTKQFIQNMDHLRKELLTSRERPSLPQLQQIRKEDITSPNSTRLSEFEGNLNNGMKNEIQNQLVKKISDIVIVSPAEQRHQLFLKRSVKSLKSKANSPNKTVKEEIDELTQDIIKRYGLKSKFNKFTKPDFNTNL